MSQIFVHTFFQYINILKRIVNYKDDFVRIQRCHCQLSFLLIFLIVGIGRIVSGYIAWHWRRREFFLNFGDLF